MSKDPIQSYADAKHQERVDEYAELVDAGRHLARFEVAKADFDKLRETMTIKFEGLAKQLQDMRDEIEAAFDNAAAITFERDPRHLSFVERAAEHALLDKAAEDLRRRIILAEKTDKYIQSRAGQGEKPLDK